jgi:hypothetical protein
MPFALGAKRVTSTKRPISLYPGMLSNLLSAFPSFKIGRTCPGLAFVFCAGAWGRRFSAIAARVLCEWLIANSSGVITSYIPVAF